MIFDLSGLRLSLRGLPDPLGLRIEEDWAPFLARGTEDLFLDVEVEAEVEGDDPGPFDPKSMTAAFDASTARYHMKEGSAEVPLGGPARVRLLRSTGEKQYFALVNLVCAALAWRLPSRGGALLHAAGIVLEGRAFVLVGPEGSGKTTWAALARSAGARVLSDDIVLVEAGPGGAQALGSPFRAREFGPMRPGRWPLAAILFIAHGSASALAPVPHLLARARLTANLPFVAEAMGSDERSAKVVDSLVAAVPVRTLTFARDPSFLDLLRGFEG